MGWYVATPETIAEAGPCPECKLPIQNGDRIYFTSTNPLVMTHLGCEWRKWEQADA